MEPALPPLHPKVAVLLDHLDLRVVDAVKWNLLLCTRKDDEGKSPTLVLKYGSDQRKSESIAYETRIISDVLSGLDKDVFQRLVFPEVVGYGEVEGVAYLLMNYIRGEQLVYKWSELTFKPEILGGKAIDPSVARMVIDVLRDLRLVDITTLPDFVRRFSFDAWFENFKVKSDGLVKFGLIEPGTVEEALRLFTSQKTKRYEGSMFTNGDFYPRNFILLPEGKIAVVDWVGGIDPWEFVAMYAWLLMWGNAEWQGAYIKEIKQHFPVDLEEMQAGLLVKSFDQIYRWRNEPEEYIGFARTQMIAYFHQALDLDYVREVFA